jgi:CheY-like chemotaxis protein
MQTVLVVEDDHNIRVTLRQTLEAAGYFVFSCGHGAEALTLLSRIKPPSLILLDWQLPILNGEEFLRVKMREPELAPIPVVVVSALASSIQPIGVKEIVRKPFDLDHLLKVVDKYCQEIPSHSAKSQSYR